MPGKSGRSLIFWGRVLYAHSTISSKLLGLAVSATRTGVRYLRGQEACITQSSQCRQPADYSPPDGVPAPCRPMSFDVAGILMIVAKVVGGDLARTFDCRSQMDSRGIKSRVREVPVPYAAKYLQCASIACSSRMTGQPSIDMV